MTGWECHVSKHDTGHPTPENPLWEFSLTSAETLSSQTITLIRLDDYIGVRTQTERNGVSLVLPQLKFLAAELVQQGFIFKEAA